MKKKELFLKINSHRDNTPDSTRQKLIKAKRPIVSITPSGSSTNIKKKLKAQKNPINICQSNLDINMTQKNNNKSKIQNKLELNKTTIEPKKENKKEFRTINPNNLNNETRAKSAVKRIIKPKNKDKEKNKKEEIKKEDNKNEIKKEEIIKEKNIQLPKNNIIKKGFNEIKNNKNASLKQKNNQQKKNLNQKEIIENKNRKNSLKKRKGELVKTPDKIKSINYNKVKDVNPLKTKKFGERGELKFGMNRNKKEVMNKTPDAGRIRNHKNIGGDNNLTTKKAKYGNVDIKSIIKSSNSNENEKLNKEEKLNEEENIGKNKKEEAKNIKYRYMRNKKYNSNYLECLSLVLNSGFFNPKKKLNIIINSKDLYTNIDKKILIKELINYYDKIGNQKIINNDKNKKKYDLKKINEPFKPNERSINALNFIDKDEELKLINEVQHPYITELFKAVLILLDEYKNTNEQRNIFEYFFNELLIKHKAKNIKKLMVNHFVDERLIINDQNFELIQNMLKIKPDLFSPATLLRYNRAVAYFSFFVKDLFSYLNLKTEDGKYFYKIRENLPKNEYQEKINKLKLLL